MSYKPTRDKVALRLSREGVEVWRAVKGFEGVYEVSNLGNVKSLARLVIAPYLDTFRNRNLKEKLLKLPTNDVGYCVVTLCKDGVERSWNVHDLVTRAFCGPRPKGWETRHLDGNPSHNVLYNLKYGTVRENSKDRVDHGTHNRGDANYSAKLSEKQVRYILSKAATERNRNLLADRFGVRPSTIKAIQERRSWRHLDGV